MVRVLRHRTEKLGHTERVRFGTGSQVSARLPVQARLPLGQLPLADMAEFTTAWLDRHDRTGKSHHHYLPAVSNAQRYCATSGSLTSRPPAAGLSVHRTPHRVRPPVRVTMFAYLERKRATCQP